MNQIVHWIPMICHPVMVAFHGEREEEGFRTLGCVPHEVVEYYEKEFYLRRFAGRPP